MNDAAEYHEEGTDESSSASGLRLVPARRVDLAPSATWEKATSEGAPGAPKRAKG